MTELIKGEFNPRAMLPQILHGRRQDVNNNVEISKTQERNEGSFNVPTLRATGI